MDFFLVACGYLLGSIPVGILAARMWELDDIRKMGSGNVGTENVLRCAGKTAALVTLAGDILKGIVPVAAAKYFTGDEWIIAGTALAVVVGHCWPVSLRFRGGKGMATAAGAGIALAPVAGLGLFVLGWALVFASRYTVPAAMVVLVTGLFVFYVTDQPAPYVGYIVVVGTLIVWRLRENIKALIQGEELKFGS